MLASLRSPEEMKLASAMRQPSLQRVLRFLGAALLCYSAVSFAIAWHHQRRYRDVVRAIASGATTDEERVLRTFELVSQWEYFDPARIHSPLMRGLARLEHRVPTHLTAYSVLEAGVDRGGPCGGTTRAMIVLLREAGIPARKALLYEAPNEPQHTVVEVWLDGEWRVFDPSYAYYWVRDRDGRIATVADLAADPDLFARILDTRPHYPVDVYHYRYVHHLRWEKVPGLALVKALLGRFKGDEWVRRVRTPYAYERPYVLGGSLAALSGLIALLAAARMRLAVS